jgi:hypothetical protein
MCNCRVTKNAVWFGLYVSNYTVSIEDRNFNVYCHENFVPHLEYEEFTEAALGRYHTRWQSARLLQVDKNTVFGTEQGVRFHRCLG